MEHFIKQINHLFKKFFKHFSSKKKTRKYACIKKNKREFKENQEIEQNFDKILEGINQNAKLVTPTDTFHSTFLNLSKKEYKILNQIKNHTTIYSNDELNLLTNHLRTFVSQLNTTSEFYDFRFFITPNHDKDRKVRNYLLDRIIENNEKLQYIYTWTKFQRIITKSKVNCSIKIKHLIKENKVAEKEIEKIKSYIQKIIRKSLKENGMQTKNLLNYSNQIQRNDFRKFESETDFIKRLITEDWPIDILYFCLLTANISKENLLTAAKEVEKALDYIIKTLNQNPNITTQSTENIVNINNPNSNKVLVYKKRA